jgi:hypothetical protein
MAFQSTRNQSNAGNFNRSTNAVARKDSGESKSIQITGMYDGKQGSKLIAKGMKLKEPVTIPAGYTVKLFVKGGKSKTGKDLPTYELVAQPPRSDV